VSKNLWVMHEILRAQLRGKKVVLVSLDKEKQDAPKKSHD
jgi:hypothetical protein